VDRKRKLFEVVGALHPSSRLASGLDGREQKSHQDTDNGDDDQKFDQGKATPSSGWRHSGGLVGNRCKRSWHEVSLWANRKSLAGLDRRINPVFANGNYNQLQKNNICNVFAKTTGWKHQDSHYRLQTPELCHEKH
jgi:hypothetical protein